MSMQRGREEQAIAERAFAIWEEEGRPDGRSLAHWFKAEAEIKLEGVFGPMVNEKPAKRKSALQGA